MIFSSDPKILGRFNYVIFRDGFYNVIFFPWGEGIYTVIAINLSKESAIALVQDLNAGLKETNAEFSSERGDV